MYPNLANFASENIRNVVILAHVDHGIETFFISNRKNDSFR